MLSAVDPLTDPSWVESLAVDQSAEPESVAAFEPVDPGADGEEVGLSESLVVKSPRPESVEGSVVVGVDEIEVGSFDSAPSEDELGVEGKFNEPSADEVVVVDELPSGELSLPSATVVGADA